MLLALAGVIGLNVYLYTAIEKGFMPEQDTGRVMGFIRADQASSYQAMEQRLQRFLAIVQADPAVEHVTGFTGGGQRNAAMMFMSLKPLAERKLSSEQVIERLRQQLKTNPARACSWCRSATSALAGAKAVARLDYTLQADDIQDLRTWEPRIRRPWRSCPSWKMWTATCRTSACRPCLQSTATPWRAGIEHGADRRHAERRLWPAPGGRDLQPAEPVPRGDGGRAPVPAEPETLRGFFFVNSRGERVPLTAFARITQSNTPLSVNHERGTPASTVSFSLAPGVSLSQATAAIQQAVAQLGCRCRCAALSAARRGFSAGAGGQPLLILAAMVAHLPGAGHALREPGAPAHHFVHALPSAGVGAVLALMLFKTEFSLIALIGVILLIGIVKKNAIMMIDFALARQRQGHRGRPGHLPRRNLRLRPSS